MPKPTARLIAAAPEMHALLHKLAYEPVGEAEATAAQILDALADEARALLARIGKGE